MERCIGSGSEASLDGASPKHHQNAQQLPQHEHYPLKAQRLPLIPMGRERARRYTQTADEKRRNATQVIPCSGKEEEVVHHNTITTIIARYFACHAGNPYCYHARNPTYRVPGSTRSRRKSLEKDKSCRQKETKCETGHNLQWEREGYNAQRLARLPYEPSRRRSLSARPIRSPEGAQNCVALGRKIMFDAVTVDNIVSLTNLRIFRL